MKWLKKIFKKEKWIEIKLPGQKSREDKENIQDVKIKDDTNIVNHEHEESKKKEEE